MALMGILVSCYVYGQYSIKGKVKSESGEALPGATVVIKGTSNGSVADGDGNYAITSLERGEYVVKASFLGFDEQQQYVTVKDSDVKVDFVLKDKVILNDAVTVYATRANDETPTTYENVSKEEISERNLGQDLPYVLRMTPSMVVNSDAGAGVGYTAMRIRGSDGSRINVTVNGIPINDSESHGTYWVNMPDFASSVNNLQIQRGVGTSTNGAGAFGATISMQTGQPSKEAFGQIDNSYGSFNTRKHTVMFNSGLIQDRWGFEGRLSQIASDGYIDRSASNLKSYYLSGGYYGDKTTVKAITFGGKEVTQQAWYGTPEVKLEGDTSKLADFMAYSGEYETQEQIDNLYNSDSRKFNYYTYDREVDNYQQDHYQLHLSHSFSEALNINASGHYTYGRGYFEQYRNQDDFESYGLENVLIGDSTIETTDLIRRRWLDNHFYGVTGSINYRGSNWSTTLGGAYNFYDGDHFGEIIWAQYASNGSIRKKYYDNYGQKSDLNVYSKTNYQATSSLNLFVDLQVRRIDYKTKGMDNDRSMIDTGGDYFFFNPKLGATYDLSPNTSLYASYAVANREPVRTDFIDAPAGKTPKHETLRNLEAGIRTASSMFSFSANYFLMSYQNELVATGAVNDVGSSIRVNVDNSYRTGIELVGGVKFSELLEWQGNTCL